MSRRYFVESPIRDAAVATLVDAEAHHLLHVMRAKVGEQVTLFDGSGHEFAARIEKPRRGEVELAVLSREAVDRELPFDFMLAVALPKGDRQRWLVEKLTELGASRLVPLETERGVAQPTDKALERLRRTVIEACKQCGRNRLLEIVEPVSLEQAISTAEASCWLAHPALHNHAARPLRELLNDQQPNVAVRAIVGPEGGFSETEVQRAVELRATLMDLGPRVLRIETAAVAIAAAVTLGRVN